MADYATSIEIDAPPEVVFEHLVVPERMVAWMGQHAELDPRPDGTFSVDINGSPVRGRYLEVDPPHRVVVSWGVAGSDVHPPGSSQVEFTLVPTGGGTRLDLRHTGVPNEQARGHAEGWEHFAARLRVVAAGGDAGRDPWAERWRSDAATARDRAD
ncbi:MAG: SRPBCC family protein [Acidimicrobiia bacterium]